MAIRTVLFDLGGTIEDIASDPAEQARSLDLIQHLLVSYDPAFAIGRDEFHATVKDGFCRYKQWSSSNRIELEGDVIWGDWIFAGFKSQRALFKELGEMLTDIWETLYFKRDIKPEAVQMLSELKDEGYVIGVISNTTSRRMPSLLMEKYGISSYFDCMFLSSVEGIRKPDPEIFLRAARFLSTDPRNCLYVGDQASRDCYGPHLAGYGASVLISSDMVAGDTQYDDYVRYRISNLSELPPLVRRMKKGGE